MKQYFFVHFDIFIYHKLFLFLLRYSLISNNDQQMRKTLTSVGNERIGNSFDFLFLLRFFYWQLGNRSIYQRWPKRVIAWDVAGASTLAGLQSDLFIKGLSDNWLTLQKRVRSGESRKNTQQNPVPGGQVGLSNYGWEMPGILHTQSWF